MSDIQPREKEVLRALYDTHKRHAKLYLDLITAFPDWHPNALQQLAADLESRQLLQLATNEQQPHVLCKITDKGLQALQEAGLSRGFLGFHKKAVMSFGVLLLVMVLGLGAGGVIPLDALTGDVTGIGLNVRTKTILTEWIEEAEQENSDHYTFSLLEKLGTRKTYLVECRTEFLHDCKYKVAFIEVDEKTGDIVNVELPRSE